MSRPTLLVQIEEGFDPDCIEMIEAAIYQLKGVSDVEYLEHKPAPLGQESGTIKWGATGRGFGHGAFSDYYGQKCSVQNSSLASLDAIWLGIDNTGPRIEGPSGKKDEDIMGRMHLNKEQARDIITVLQRFVDTGSITPPEEA